MTRTTKGSRVDFSRSAVARYIQLSTLFRGRIDSGEWAIGQQIPTVDQLATEFSVARATVRQALDVLEDDGVIERFRAKGTFVTGRTPQALWHEIPTDWSGLLLAPEEASIEILGIDNGMQPPRLHHEIGRLAPSYRRFSRRHSRHQQVYYKGDAYVDERLADRISNEALATKTTLRMLKDLDGLKIAEVHQTLTVGMADVLLAHTFDIPLNAPVVYIGRTAVDDTGTVIFVGDGVYRGDVIRLDVKVT
ncbi:GntR family transcriptional regulator [Micromonospora sp. NPDC049523]|uniref:GntR family transcriptional regulator n=1 Tax=Micromonospora sp. NPDC049523 TaxID=3155921 RepID=UPI00342D21D2